MLHISLLVERITMNSETNIQHDQNQSNSAWKSRIAFLILWAFLVQFDLRIFFNLLAQNTRTCSFRVGPSVASTLSDEFKGKSVDPCGFR